MQLNKSGSQFCTQLCAHLEEKFGDEITNTLEFDRAEIERGSLSCTVHFTSSRILSKYEYNLVSEAVNEALPANMSSAVQIHYTDFNAEELRAVTLQRLSALKPFYAKLCKKAQWTLQDDRIDLTFDSYVNIEHLIKAGIKDLIVSAVKDLFGKQVAVFMYAKENYEKENDEADTKQYLQQRQQAATYFSASEKPQQAEPVRDTTAEEAAPEEKAETKKKQDKPEKRDDSVLLGRSFTGEVTPMSELDETADKVIIRGELIELEEKQLKNGDKTLLLLSVTDYTSSAIVKFFVKNEIKDELIESINKAKYLLIRGQSQWDKFSNDQIIRGLDILRAAPFEEKQDNAKEKRIELHLHTRMSQMDSVVNPTELVQTAIRYGHDALAITDHGVVQAFPDMEAAVAKYKADIKLLFGCEIYLYDDEVPFIDIKEDLLLDKLTYVVFDVETTGLEAQRDKLIEIAAVKLVNGEYAGRFTTFVDPGRDIPDKIVKLTGINNSMVKGAMTDKQAVLEFLEFAQDAVLVAHNASFDLSFIRFAANKYDLSFKNASMDTLALSRMLFPDLKSHKLDKLCSELNIKLEGHHRAINDAEATASMFLKFLQLLKEKEIADTKQLNNAANMLATGETYHAIVFAQNKTGLFNLYKLVTESHLHHFYRRPRVPKSCLIKYREGLLLGTACEAGELFTAILNKAKMAELNRIAEFYDYMEVQPLGNNEFLIREGRVKDKKELQNCNKKIIELAYKHKKPVVATGDVHFLRDRDSMFRSIILNSQGFEDADKQAPLYYRTTEEMLEEFNYLDKDTAYEIVVTNTRKIADLCERMESFPRDKLYTPKMEGAEEEITQMAMNKAYAIYGNPLPELVQKRLDKELTAIIKHGFAVLYLIAQKVVGKSLSDGYLVGSRGSVGSSFVATMTDITEVNPLPPHYVCPQCQYSNFEVDTTVYGCGFDLPKEKCPVCGADLNRAGFDIPFEVFMGFDGDKAPDIDLNFSGEYQPVIHKYIEELFGSDYVFRAGTISGVAEKTAMGYVLKYCEEKDLRINMAEKKRLAKGCEEVKRTTGQHPGGMVVLPKEYDIHQFTPLQYPSNDSTKGIITTHFDFNSLHDTMLKLDILGHDDPTMIRMLEKLTGLNARSIPLDDEKPLSLFLNTSALGIRAEDLGSPVGTFGVPEMGTAFVRKMLVETKPQSFADLVRISGLSHGTDVWTNNAQTLVNEGIAALPELICTREDIMTRLIQKGVSSKIAFKTMEYVRKGKAKKGGLPEEMKNAMLQVNMPDWFIESCEKIGYMFPKAHAAAYVTMAIRIAYYKVYYPVAFYMTYFTVRADDFEVGLMQGGVESVRTRIKEYYDKPNLNPREKGILTMLELALEMKLRGIDFLDVDIYQSEASEFTVCGENRIRPPLNALAGLGESAAKSIVQARRDGEFTSLENLMQRAKISKTVLEVLQNNGCLRGMPQSEQIMFFELD